MTRGDFLRREDRRRSLLSWALAAGFYTLAFLLFLLFGRGGDSELGELPSPVWISLEAPAAEAAAIPPPGPPGEVELPLGPSLPGLPPAPEPRLDPRTGPPPAESPPAATPSPPSAAPLASTGQAENAQAAAAAALPAEPWVPGPRPQGSRILSSETGGSETPRSGGGFSTRIQGAESGNSLETRLGGPPDKVGRSLYVPVYLYMPLPSLLDAALLERLRPELREIFLPYYTRMGSGYRLQRQVPPAERDGLWIALEDAGYDLSRAEYKASGRLTPVELEFVVTPASNGSPPRLEALRIVGSSGDRSVDEAVQYGFRRSAFFNSTDAAVSGSFSYRFQ